MELVFRRLLGAVDFAGLLNMSVRRSSKISQSAELAGGK